MDRRGAERGWQRRQRRKDTAGGSHAADGPPLSERDRAAIDAIRRELDLEFGPLEEQIVDDHDDRRARPPWAFLVTLAILLLAVAGTVGSALYVRREPSPELAGPTPPPSSTAAVPAETAPPASRATPRTDTSPVPVPESPVERSPSEATAPAGPASADATESPDTPDDRDAEDSGTGAEPPPLPPRSDPRLSRSPEADPAPEAKEEAVRPELPPFDYSKRRPSLPPRTLRD